MPKQLSPQEKKRLSYEKDHIPQPESDKAFRKTWPLVKAQTKRIERRRVRQILTNTTATGTDDQRGDLALKPIRRKRARKFARVVPLREHVSDQLLFRVKRNLHDFLKQPYSPERRDRFDAFLSTVMEICKPNLRRAYAETLDNLLIATGDYRRLYYIPTGDRKWLRDFFADMPEWESRLREWVDEMLAA